MKVIEQWGTYPSHEPDNITWWDTEETAEQAAKELHHSRITRTKIVHDQEITSPSPKSEYPDAPLMTVNWDRDEVPEGFVDLTFRVPEHGRGFHGRMTADITLKDNR